MMIREFDSRPIPKSLQPIFKQIHAELDIFHLRNFPEVDQSLTDSERQALSNIFLLRCPTKQKLQVWLNELKERNARKEMVSYTDKFKTEMSSIFKTLISPKI